MFLRPNLVLVITIFTLLNVQAVEIKRGRYRFNHPPSVESADTAPLAEVHESGVMRESKTLKLPVDTVAVPTEGELDKKEDVKKTNDSIPTPVQELKSDDAIPATQKKNVARKPLMSRINSRRNLKNEEKIPVNVVYDTDSNKAQAPEQKSEEGTNKLFQRRNQIKRRLQKPTVDDTQKEEQKLKEEQSKKEEQKLKEEQNLKEQQKLQEELKLQEQQQLQEQKLKEEFRQKEEQKEQETKVAESTSTAAPSSPSPKVETTQTTATKEQPHVTTERSRKRWRTREPIVPIVTEENFVYSHSGNFHYRFEGGDGTKVFEEGTLKTINKDAGEAVQGGFSYTDKEGNDFSISYTADENGYRPMGAHIPTPPPIPPAIARALAYLATKPTPQPVTESIAYGFSNLD